MIGDKINCPSCNGAGGGWWETHSPESEAADPHDCHSDDTWYVCDMCGGKGYVVDKENVDTDWLAQ